MGFMGLTWSPWYYLACRSMDELETKLREEYKGASNAKLREIKASRGPTQPAFWIIEQILIERDQKWEFVKLGLPGYIALVLSVIALIRQCP